MYASFHIYASFYIYYIHIQESKLIFVGYLFLEHKYKWIICIAQQCLNAMFQNVSKFLEDMHQVKSLSGAKNMQMILICTWNFLIFNSCCMWIVSRIRKQALHFVDFQLMDYATTFIPKCCRIISFKPTNCLILF